MQEQPQKLEALETYLEKKTQKNGIGGRPNFFQQIEAEGKDVFHTVITILEDCWLLAKSKSKVAKAHRTGKDTIYRLLADLEAHKPEILKFLAETPHKRQWFNPETETSDYETIMQYIKRAKREGLVSWHNVVTLAKHCWRALKYKNPKNWNIDEVSQYLNTLSKGARATQFDAIRQVAPQFRDQNSDQYMSVAKFRSFLSRRMIDVFSKELNMIRTALKKHGKTKELLQFDLHVTGGFREGSTSHGHKSNAGICGITWDRFKKDFTRVDDFESKTKAGGIWWRNCPTDLFFTDLPARLKAEWKRRDKPTTGYVIEGRYDELRRTYKTIQKVLQAEFEGKIEPYLLKQFTSITAHYADKIHVNCLHEAGVKLEVVAGKYVGGNEGRGIVGRGWLRTETITRYYLMLSERSEEVQKNIAKVHAYRTRFNGGAVA